MKITIISLIISIIVFLITYTYLEFFSNIGMENYHKINEHIVDFYGKNLRGNLFSGFLALGGFIFSLKAFILVTMKQNVYDSEDYEKKWRERNNNSTDGKAYFLPLKDLNNILYMTVLLSIISAISNITLGLIPHILVVYICISCCLTALIYLVKSLILIKGNLDTWFEYLSLNKTFK